MSDDAQPEETSPSPEVGDPPALVARRSLALFDDATVLEVVDGLDLRPSSRVSPAIAVFLRGLQQRHDVRAFVTGAPTPAVRALLELLVSGTLEDVVRELGASADDPSYDELTRALDALSAQGTPPERIAALLGHAVAESFPAAPHCRRLLGERPEWTLPSVDRAPAPSVLAPREVDPEVRERRRERRAARRVTSPRPRPVHPPRSRHASPAEDEEVSAPAPRSLSWRRTPLTPAEAREVTDRHPLVGAVVMIEVPFDAVDPTRPDEREKRRPALVVAASESQLLVRALFTKPRPGRIPFRPWRRVGLDHPSFLSDERTSVDRGEVGVVELGRLSAAEWNGLW